ncbi:MAG: hypothetical protein QG652_863, partial [Pseudomonadota bacterium]|nr:hypothetical protein [Pseudomonadota bacterium]
EHRGTEKEYRFDIRIDKVHAIRKIDVFEEGKPSRSIYMLDFTLDVPSMKWSKIGTELKD